MFFLLFSGSSIFTTCSLATHSFARAKTGTGKTVAFLLPMIQKILNTPQTSRDTVSALIITPTRDLAQQIVTEAQKLAAGTGLGIQCAIGGTNMNREWSDLSNKRADILVGTPGRLQDHITSNGLDKKSLHSLRFFVLDEADRLLDEGFAPNVERIISSLPSRSAVPR
jgi:ATP-dependent RNA helicase MSS116